MTSLKKPGFSTCYYIRKILLQYVDELKAILSQEIGFCFNSKETLEQLLHSVYLEETLEQILHKLYPERDELHTKVQLLEILASRHQKILVDNPFNYQELGEIKRRIFGILGFKRVIVKMEDLVNSLNQLIQLSHKCLGATLTFNTWQSSRPQFDWLDNFKINRSDKKIIFSGIISETANANQLEWIQAWVSAFTCKISQIILDFKTTIEQQRVGELPGGVLLIQMNSYSCWIDSKTKTVH